MAKRVGKRKINDLFDASEDDDRYEAISYTAVLITQGRHRFHTLTMPSDTLAATCVVDTASENPIDGFQRNLDKRRAQEIAEYIDTGFGTIPGSIVLSAQPEAHFTYSRTARTVRFRKHPRAFLILDGQHRVYGFYLANAQLRVPVVIYNSLSREDEARLFMDINTKQRPVPNELLLHIKRLADTENDMEALFRDVFDHFYKDQRSPLFGLMSPISKKRGKISRVTFNAALKAIGNAFSGAEPEYVYEVLGAYIKACISGLRQHRLERNITNPTLFRALVLLFPVMAERVEDRHGRDFSVAHFDEIVGPFFRRVKKSDLQRPGQSYQRLHESFRKTLRSGFTLGRN